jgi:hypothetical protein
MVYPVSTALVISVDISTITTTIQFNQPVILAGFPSTWRATGVGGAVPISATQSAPDTIDVVWSTSVAAATAIEITPFDPAVRTPTGGFAAALAFPVE